MSTFESSPQINRMSAYISGVGQMLTAGLIGTLGFMATGDFARQALLSVSLLVLAMVAGISWHQSRVDERRRLLAAVDAYANREMRLAQLSQQTE